MPDLKDYDNPRQFILGKPADPNAGIGEALDEIRFNPYGRMPLPETQLTEAEQQAMYLQDPEQLGGLKEMGYKPGGGAYENLVADTSPEGVQAQRRALEQMLGVAQGGGTNYAAEALRAQTTADGQAQLGAMRGMGLDAQLQGNRAALNAGYGAASQGSAMGTERQLGAIADASQYGGEMRKQSFGEQEKEATGQQAWDKWYTGRNQETKRANWENNNRVLDFNSEVAGDLAGRRVKGNIQDFSNNMTRRGTLSGMDQDRARIASGYIEPGAPSGLSDFGDIASTVGDVATAAEEINRGSNSKPIFDFDRDFTVDSPDGTRDGERQSF